MYDDEYEYEDNNQQEMNQDSTQQEDMLRLLDLGVQVLSEEHITGDSWYD